VLQSWLRGLARLWAVLFILGWIAVTLYSQVEIGKTAHLAWEEISCPGLGDYGPDRHSNWCFLVASDDFRGKNQVTRKEIVNQWYDHNLQLTIQAFCYHPLGTLLVGDRCFVNEREYKRDFVDKVVALSYQRALIGAGEGTHLDLSSQDENSLFPSAASQRLWYDPWVIGASAVLSLIGSLTLVGIAWVIRWVLRGFRFRHT
jgi:stress-induced morphogen